MEIATVSTTRLHYQHKVIVDLIDGLNDDLIRHPVVPGKWSLFENLVHLQTYQHVFNRRVEAIRDGHEPCFESYSADQDPEFQENCRRPTREVLQDLLHVRKEMAARLPQLSSRELSLCGVHGVFGRMNLAEWVNFFLLHEAHHLYAMFRQAAVLRQSLHTTSAPGS